MSTATAQVKDRLADYVPVSERLEQFWDGCPDGRVLTTILEHNIDEGFILMRAEIYRNQDETTPAATGHAFENRTSGYVNKTSYIENCETSAVGRALALLGYEIKRGIASREEMEKVARMSEAKPGLNEARRALIGAIQDAAKVANKLGAEPKWTTKLVNEFANENFNTKGGVDSLTEPQLTEMAALMSKQIDELKLKKMAEDDGPPF